MSGFGSGSQVYTLTCANDYGVTAVTVTVRIVPRPTVTLTANGQTNLIVPPYSGFTLAWSSSGAQTCAASDSWSGDKALSGSQNFKGFDRRFSHLYANMYQHLRQYRSFCNGGNRL